MANLDFRVRYTEDRRDEIGILGGKSERLSEKLESALDELKEKNTDLEKSIKLEQQLEQQQMAFFSAVSHELKTPIALIQGYAEGLRDGITEEPESMEFYCDVIIDEANKMNQMVKNLLTLNQLEFGDEDLEITRFNLVG